VEVDLSTPLKSGAIMDIGIKKLWVEFKYERLPHYCYSCEKIDHYATNCEEIPYEQTAWVENKVGKYGPWLKAEVRDHSPYWDAFYGKVEEGFTVEETALEIPPITYEMDLVARDEIDNLTAPNCNKKRAENFEVRESPEEPADTTMKTTDHGKQIICFEANKPISSKVGKCSKKNMKVQREKKHKCIAEEIPFMIDDTELLET